MLAYFEARCETHKRVLRARRNVTETQVLVATALMAGRDFERRYGVTVGDAIRALV
jgi:hypothetical protein